MLRNNMCFIQLIVIYNPSLKTNCHVVICGDVSEERTQLANKTKALSRLKAKLLVIAEEQRASEIKQIRGDAVKAEWGQQIRNYVFHPYKLVKDIRTGEEMSNITAVMDGELDPFIRAYLKYKFTASLSETSTA
jgi:peptide chain release factor 2